MHWEDAESFGLLYTVLQRHLGIRYVGTRVILQSQVQRHADFIRTDGRHIFKVVASGKVAAMLGECGGERHGRNGETNQYDSQPLSRENSPLH